MEILLYKNVKGFEPLVEWLDNLRDKRAQIRIRQRLKRLEFANFGDCEPVGGGVFELKFHFGPGYRVYFGRAGNSVVLLLCGGSKKNQSRDIKRAKNYWKEYKGL